MTHLMYKSRYKQYNCLELIYTSVFSNPLYFRYRCYKNISLQYDGHWLSFTWIKPQIPFFRGFLFDYSGLFHTRNMLFRLCLLLLYFHSYCLGQAVCMYTQSRMVRRDMYTNCTSHLIIISPVALGATLGLRNRGIRATLACTNLHFDRKYVSLRNETSNWIRE